MTRRIQRSVGRLARPRMAKQSRPSLDLNRPLESNRPDARPDSTDFSDAHTRLFSPAGKPAETIESPIIDANP